MPSKKKNAETQEQERENETRPKAQARTDVELLTEKVNSAGNIMLKQIKKLESAQRNAIKAGKISQFNKAIDTLAEKLSAVKLAENASVDEPTATSFDIASFEE